MCRFHGGAAPQIQRAAANRFAHLVDPAIDQLAKALRSENASVAVTAARDILDRNGLKTISSPPEISALDLQKLSTDELVVLDAITRKARGQPIMELAAARLVIKELARKLARRKQKQMV